jgi:DNA-binding protein HU-beta
MRDQFTKLNEFTTSATATVAENIDRANERALDALVDANRRLVEFAVTTADRLSEQISVELPFTDRFPTPAESGERYLDFVERAVAVNREFNDRIVTMLKADAPAAADRFVATATRVADAATDKTVETVADAATAAKTTATKTPARKTPARKTTARKTTATKTPARKTPARKTPARKTTAKRADTTTAAAKKTTAAKATAPASPAS